MKKRELVYDILKLALGEDLSCGDGLANVTPQDWDWAFKTLSMHGLGAFAYDSRWRSGGESSVSAGCAWKVAVEHLGLSIDDVPMYIRQEMALLKPWAVERFIDDLFRPYEQIHQKNIIAERMHSVRRIIKAAWKPKEFLGQSAVGFVWDKFLPILRGQKFEAD